MNLDIDFPFQIVRSKRRKTLTIQVMGDNVKVLAPKQAAEQRILDVIRQKQVWIKDKLRLHAKFAPAKPKEYINGENFSYLGKDYKLKLMSQGPQEVQLQDGYLQLGLKKGLSDIQKPEYIRKQLLSWYRQNAKECLLEKTEYYAKILNVQPKSVSVHQYKGRWGSCSQDKDIKYNWRIIIAPHPIVDYVVAHELCHILEPNHSPAFWKCVEGVLVDYRERKKWLKLHGLYLVV